MLAKDHRTTQQIGIPKALLAYIEARLAAFYQFELSQPAGDFLLDEASLAACLEECHGEEPLPPRPRAGVWLFHDATPGEVFLGIHFAPAILAALHTAPPLESLCNANLDSFCVVVEELSHFHLLRQRLLQGRPLSQLELEWQGEIDKTLLAAELLERQAGHPQLKALTRKIFDEAQFTAEAAQLSHYAEASHYAAKFWHQLIAEGLGETIPLHDPSFCRLLRRNYEKPLEEKYPFSSYRRAA